MGNGADLRGDSLEPPVLSVAGWLALVLTWLYEKTDNLLAPIAAHSLFNALNFIALQLYDYLPQHAR